MFSQPTTVKSWNLEGLQRWERLITYGRPGWTALWKVNAHKNMNPYSPNKLLRLAERKLTAGIQNSTWVLTNGEEMLVRSIKLTLLSRRALIRIGFHSQEARCMVASCMGICTGISHDLKLIRVQSLSEPILSEAAARLINRHNLWPDLLETLIHGVQHGFVNTGAAGEIAAWVILSIAWDAACIRKFQTSDVITYTRSDVSVKDFIEALLGYVPEINPKEIPDGTSKQEFSGEASDGASKKEFSSADSDVASEKEFSSAESDGASEKEISSAESDGEIKQEVCKQGSECTRVKINKQTFVEELMARRICFTHMAQLSSTKATFEHLKNAACRMQFSVCAPLTYYIDAFAPLFPAREAESQDLWSMQIQVRNHGQFDKKISKVSLEKMSEAAMNMAKTADSENTSFLSGLDVYMHIGHKVQGYKYCDFHVKPKSVRACLVLSTDSCLTLFQSAIKTVCGEGNHAGAAKLTSLLSRLIDLERLTLSQKGPWSMDHLPDSVKKPPAWGQIPLHKQLENLQQMMCTGDTYHLATATRHQKQQQAMQPPGTRSNKARSKRLLSEEQQERQLPGTTSNKTKIRRLLSEEQQGNSRQGMGQGKNKAPATARQQ